MSHWHPNHWFGADTETFTIIPSSPTGGDTSFGLLDSAATAGEATNLVLQRVRDPSSRSHSRTFVRMVLSAIQNLVNAKYALVLGTATLTTRAYQQFYPIHGHIENMIRVTAVREDGRDLLKTDWRELWYLDRDWARRTGSRFATWSAVGRDLLIVHPAKRETSQATIVYARTLTPLTSDYTPLETPADMLPLVYDLTEAVLLLKARTYAPLKRLTEAIQARMMQG